MRTPRLMAIGLSAGLIATGCSSDEGSEDACSAFCSAFARGNNCGDVIATCPSECSALSTGCPARAEAFFSCLGKLDYSCSAPGQANAAGDGLDYVAVYANSGTLYVNDSQCARLYNEFVNCGAGGQGGAGGDAGASQGGLGGGGTGGVGGSGAGGSGAGGSGDGGVGGGGSSGASGAGGAGGGGSGGTPDLANVTFHLNYTTTPADPNGEGGPAVPYKVQVCIDPSDNGYIRVDNIGSASAGSFYAAILWVKDFPATGTIVDSCAPFSSSQALAPGYNVSWENAYCCDLSDTFSTFDANPRRIVVYADALEQVSESDESNNSASSEVFEP